MRPKCRVLSLAEIKKRPCDFEYEVAGALCLFDRQALVAWYFVYSRFIFKPPHGNRRANAILFSVISHASDEAIYI